MLFCVQVLQDQFGSSIHTALIIKPDNFWQKQRTNLGSQKYKFEVNSLNLFNTWGLTTEKT
jgi:triple functional domain protein